MPFGWDRPKWERSPEEWLRLMFHLWVVTWVVSSLVWEWLRCLQQIQNKARDKEQAWLISSRLNALSIDLVAIPLDHLPWEDLRLFYLDPLDLYNQWCLFFSLLNKSFYICSHLSTTSLQHHKCKVVPPVLWICLQLTSWKRNAWKVFWSCYGCENLDSNLCIQ